MYIADRWEDYELLDAGAGEKLERWGQHLLQRPDPQAIWPHDAWPEPAARYQRSISGGGGWQYLKALPERWLISYPGLCGPLRFRVEPMNFKHTGIFPEQAANWDFCCRSIQRAVARGKNVRVLNLFAYTGAATVACASAGAAEVVHLDASRGMIARARENVQLSGLGDRLIRFIQEDAVKFVEREVRRGRRYEVVIMDPPAYGRGPDGELWKLEDSLYALVERCASLLSEQPLFFILNTYASGLAPAVLTCILDLVISRKYGGKAEAAELGLPAAMRPFVLPCGSTGRWVAT